MLKKGILNARLAEALAGLRHKDRFVVSDCGLPVQQGIEVIDLAVVFGVPRFEQVLDALKSQLVLENAVIAQEARDGLPEKWVRERFDIPVSYIPHNGAAGFKDSVRDARFVIRTGETTSFANVIFQCEVPF